MNDYLLEYIDEAKNDLKKLDNSAQIQVRKGIIKTLQNPLPKSEGGYGAPLGSHNNSNLTNCLKIKFLKIGIRVVYKL